MKNNKQTQDDEKSLTIDMPEVKDIPGQEHVKPPRMGEMIDTTISSSDEEGEGIVDELNADDDVLIENESEDQVLIDEVLIDEESDDDVSLDEEDEDEVLIDEENNVSLAEKSLLEKSDRPDSEEMTDIRKTALDKTDGEDPLNEEGDMLDMGEDLDIPGSELDDEDEELGEEDEENNSYSNRD